MTSMGMGEFTLGRSLDLGAYQVLWSARCSEASVRPVTGPNTQV